MPNTPNTTPLKISLNLKFEGVKEKEQPPESAVYAFDATGQFLASAPVDKGKATLSLPGAAAERTVRFFAGPRTEKPTIAKLAQMKAVELRQRVDPQKAMIDWVIVDPAWRPWFLCSCVVRGRLIKRLKLPDGTTKDLPICHSRVTICKVFEIPLIIYRLPDDLVRRLRDEFIAVINPPIPPPPPGDPFRLGAAPFAPQAISPPVAASPGGIEGLAATVSLSAAASPASAAAPAMAARIESAEVQTRIRALSALTSVEEIRRSLVDISTILVPYFCWWPWIEPFLWVDCVTTVPTDENGNFQATLWYPCVLGAPNIYLKAEQLHGLAWEWIYRPSVYCHTYWNYSCGTEIVINVTDPSAIPCAPEDPVVPPLGVVTWVMPTAVGGTYIWGAPPMAPPAPAGRLKTNGLTDYGGFVDAPFGSFLGFRHGWSISIPSAAIKYYRWRYRKMGTSTWFDMHESVVRHYVKQPPVGLPTFPVYPLGPHTVGGNANLYEFKPPAPPGPDPSDPPGTITYWPTDDFFADIYTGYLDTPSLPPSIAAAAGQYQIKLEVFSPAGSQVMPGPAFSFIVPSTIDPDGTVHARNAEPGELDAGGFVHNLHIDNNHCTASIDAPSIGIAVTADACGFLRYDPMVPTPVTIAFHAQHPNNFATFRFTMVRGAVLVATATTPSPWDEVAALLSGSYTGDGLGNFTHDFPRADLLGACVNAAFAEHLYVFAKATTGWGTRISTYDASALRAFALAPTEP